jgi:hypothetical protein
MSREADAEALRAENDALRKQCDTLTHQIICCGLAASNLDATLTTRGAYARKWNSHQAEEVRQLRAEADRMRSALRVIHTWARVPGALDARLVRDLTGRALEKDAGT